MNWRIELISRLIDKSERILLNTQIIVLAIFLPFPKDIVDFSYIFIKNNLNMVTISPFPSVITKQINSKQEIIEYGVLNTILHILKSNIIPLLHGDVVFDSNQNCNILSGDAIIKWY